MENYQRVNDLSVLYFKNSRNIIIETRSNITFPTTTRRDIKAFSLYDLNNKDLIIEGLPFFQIPKELNFNWLQFTLETNEK